MASFSYDDSLELEGSFDEHNGSNLNISEYDARQLEYIRKLQERNRLKKQLEESSKSRDTIRKEKLERGFNLQVRGANTDRVKGRASKPTRAKVTAKPIKALGGGPTTTTTTTTSSSTSTSSRKRRGWNTSSSKKPKDLSRRARPERRSSEKRTELPADAYPFGARRIGHDQTTKAPRALRGNAAASTSLRKGQSAAPLNDSLNDYSDESFEEYDSAGEETDTSVLNIFRAVRQSHGGATTQFNNALRQSLSVSPSSGNEPIQNNDGGDHFLSVRSMGEAKSSKSSGSARRALSARPRRVDAEGSIVSTVGTSGNTFLPTGGVSSSNTSLSKSRSRGTLRPVSAHAAPLKKKRPSSAAVDRPDDVRALAQAIAAENTPSRHGTTGAAPSKSATPNSGRKAIAFKAPKSSNRGKPKTTQQAARNPEASRTTRESSDVAFQLFDRVQSLSRDQQRKLLQMLERMDGTPPRSSRASGEGKVAYDDSVHRVEGKQIEGGDSPRDLSGSDTEPEMEGTEPVPTPSPGREDMINGNRLPVGRLVTLRAFSNWGARDVIGLTEIQIFDETLRQVDLDPKWITATRTGENSEVSRLVNKKMKTTNQRHMWLCPVSPGKTGASNRDSAARAAPIIEFSVELPIATRISKIVVWNYNRSVAMSSAGMKEVSVDLDGKEIWSGEIHRAHGNKMFNYSTSIEFTSLEELSVDSCSSRIETRSRDDTILPQRKPRIPIEKLQNTKFKSATLVGVESNSSREPGHDEGKRQGQGGTFGIVSDAEIMYEVGKATGTPVWLKGDRKAPQKDVSSFPSSNFRTSKKRERRSRSKFEAVVAEPAQKIRDASDTQEDLMDAIVAEEAEESNLETSFDSLAYFERNNRGRLSKNDGEGQEGSAESEMFTRETISPTTIPISRETESGELPPTPSGAPGEFFSGIGAMLSHMGGYEDSHAPVKDSEMHEGRSTVEEKDADNRAPELFEIPQFPTGRKIQIVIKSTWGDPHYVGLSGVELFDEDGVPIDLNSCEVHADDINMLPEHEADPRTVEKLLDGNNHTCDDMHVWLAPFEGSRDVKVDMDLKSTFTLSMMRIWNYNKSRIHSYRGARWVQIFFDGTKIFDGELRKAPGNLYNSEQSAEVILFTFDDDILAMIEAEDRILEDERDNTVDLLSRALEEFVVKRPSTGDKTRNEDGGESMWRTARAVTPEQTYEQVFKETHGHRSDSTKRPKTGAIRKHDSSLSLLQGATLDSLLEEFGESTASGLDKTSAREETFEESVGSASPPLDSVRGKTISFSFLTTWGDPHFMGLTSLEVLVWQPHMEGLPYKVVPLNLRNLAACPPDINVGGHKGDPRTLDKLVDTVSYTMDDRHMWLIPYTKGGQHTLDIRLDEEMVILGIRVCNYNKSFDDTYRGVQDVIIKIDEKPVHRRLTGSAASAARRQRFDVPGLFQFRKAPGHLDVNFSQTIMLQSKETEIKSLPAPKRVINTRLRQDYETLSHPCGHTFAFALLATWGDPYYIGLDRIELYDTEGELIKVHRSQVGAAPHSINVLSDSFGAAGQVGAQMLTPAEKVGKMKEYDPRTPDKLVLTRKCKDTEVSSWLAPLTTSLEHSVQCPRPNFVYVSFDHPVAISMVKIWNYSRTPARGASSLEISVDNKLLYKGGLAQAHSLPNAYQAILFSDNEHLIGEEKRNLFYCGNSEQSVLCINERQIMGNSAQSYAAAQKQRGVGAYTYNKHEEAPRPKTGKTRRK